MKSYEIHKDDKTAEVYQTDITKYMHLKYIGKSL